MNKEDLLQIKGIVEEVFDAKLSSVMEHNIIPQFDQLHERIDKLEMKMDTQMVSKGFLEERLDKFQIDHRLTYKPAT